MKCSVDKAIQQKFAALKAFGNKSILGSSPLQEAAAYLFSICEGFQPLAFTFRLITLSARKWEGTEENKAKKHSSNQLVQEVREREQGKIEGEEKGELLINVAGINYS